ncbi:hypothetical protein HK102_005335 [Quaeritorhiza haematococci]|nr:hypothetical protein HK102_005335 [Quaeritorhiza haematococci]
MLDRELDASGAASVAASTVFSLQDPPKNMETFDMATERKEKDKLFRRILPIEIVSTAGAVMLGNPDLPTLLVVSYKEANGIYETVAPRSELDYYASSISVTFKKAKISFRANGDYRDPTQNKAARMRANVRRSDFKGRITRFFQDLFHKKKENKVPFESAYTTDIPLQKKRFVFEEYARVPDVLECDELHMTYQSDVAGPAPAKSKSSQKNDADSGEECDIGNGGVAPQWTLDLRSSMGSSTMSHMQLTYRNAEVTQPIVPGQTRLHDCFKLLIEFEGQTTWRVPFREPSKDWKYEDAEEDDDADIKVGAAKRPYPWMDLKFSPGSKISFNIPFIVTEEGCTTVIDIQLDKLSVPTSINFAEFLTAHTLKVCGRMHSPREWNKERVWTFTINTHDTRIHLLRDQITLLTDLASDFASGPPVELDYFIPIEYKVFIHLDNLELNLCVNPQNLINKHNNRDENAYMIVRSPKCDVEVALPFMTFQPSQTGIPFNVKLYNAEAFFSFPLSHTIGAFADEDAKDIGHVADLSLGGVYRYHANSDASHIDSLTMELTAEHVTAKVFGFLIRYVIYLKDNYMGDNMNFITTDEYRNRRANPEKTERMRKKELAYKGDSLFEFHLLAFVRHGTIMLPENLYSCKQASVLEVREAQVDIRNMPFLQDLQVTLNPLLWTRKISSAESESSWLGSHGSTREKNYMHFDEITIQAMRMFGPGAESLVYACDWRFHIGSIVGELQPSFLPGIADALVTFGLHFVDRDNAVEILPIFPDVTTMQLKLGQLDLSLWGQEDSVSSLKLPRGACLQTDNLVCERWHDRVFIDVPQLVIQSLAVTGDKGGAPPPASASAAAEEHAWVEVLRMDTAVTICIYNILPDWEKARNAQMDYVKEQDDLTRRCAFLYEKGKAKAHEDSIIVDIRTVQQKQEEIARQKYREDLRKTLPVCFLPFRPPFSISRNMDLYSTHGKDGVHVTNPGNNRKASSLYRLGLLDTASETSSLRSPLEPGDFEEKIQQDLLYSRNVVEGLDDADSYHTASDYSVDGYGISNTMLSAEPVEDGSFENSYTENEAAAKGTQVNRPQKSIPYRSYLRRFRMIPQKAMPLSGGGNMYGPYQHQRYHEHHHRFIAPGVTHFVPLDEEGYPNSSEEGKLHDNAEPFGSAAVDDDQSAFWSTFSSSTGFSPFDKVKEDDDGGKMMEEHADEARTVFSIHSSQAVKVFLTPIFLKIVQEFLEALNSKEVNIDSMLDGFEIRNMARLTKIVQHRYSSTSLVLSLPKVHLHCIQDMELPDSETFLNDDHHMGIRTKYDFSDAVLCSFDIIVDQFVCRVLLKNDHGATHPPTSSDRSSSSILAGARLILDMDSVKMNLRFVGSMTTGGIIGIPPEKHHFHDPADNYTANHMEDVPIVLDIYSEKIRWQGFLNQNSEGNNVDTYGSRADNCFSMSVKMKELSVVSINQTVEIMFGALITWSDFLTDLSKILSAYNERRTRQQQHAVLRLLQLSQSGELLGRDPVFLTDPSDMWKLIPRDHQKAPDWNLLCHIRYWHRILPTQSLRLLADELRADMGRFFPENGYRRVLDILHAWGRPNIPDVTSCALLTDLFQTEAAKPAEGAMEKFSFLFNSEVSLFIEKFGVDIFEYESEDNIVLIGRLDFGLRTKIQSLANGLEISEIPEASLSPSMSKSVPASERSSSKSATVPGKRREFIDVLCKLNVADVKIAFNPNMFGFIRHAVRVYKWFQPKLTTSKRFSETSLTRYSTDITDRQQAPMQRTRGGSSSASSAAGTSKLAFAFTGSTQIKKISLSTVAHNLVLRTTFSDVQSTVIHLDDTVGQVWTTNTTSAMPQASPLAATSITKAGPDPVGSKIPTDDDAAPRIIDSILLGVGAIDIRFCQRVHRTKSHGVTERALAVIAMEGITTNAVITGANLPLTTAVNNHDKSAGDKDLSVAVVVKSVSIQLPRSLLKLHTFFEKWGDEHLPEYDFLLNKLVNEMATASHSKTRRGSIESEDTVDGGGTRSSRSLPSSSSAKNQGFGVIKFKYLLENLDVQSDLLASLRVQYKAQRLLLSLDHTGAGPSVPSKRGRELGGGYAKTKTQYSCKFGYHELLFLTRGAGADSAPLETLRGGPWTQHSHSFKLPSLSSQGNITQMVGSITSEARNRSRSPMRSEGNAGKTVSRLSVGGQPQQSSSDSSGKSPSVTTVEATISLDTVEASLNVNMIDQLITAQSVLGSEVNDIVEVFTFYSRKRAQQKEKDVSRSKPKEPSSPAVLFYALKISVQRMSIAAETPSSVLRFESNMLNGFVMNHPPSRHLPLNQQKSQILQPPPELDLNVNAKILWQFAATGLSLSLVHNVGEEYRATGNSMLLHPLAYVVINFVAQNSRPAREPKLDERGNHEGGCDDGEDAGLENFLFQFNKIHAVMQPVALGKLIDVLIYYQRELTRRSEKKAQEIHRIKRNTQRLIKSINVPMPEYKVKSQSFFDDKQIIIKLSKIGAAIPLKDAEELISIFSGEGGSTPTSRTSVHSLRKREVVPAFLLSARSIELSTKRFSAGSGHVSDLSVQFVSHFDQTCEDHFSSSVHLTQNRFLLEHVNMNVHQISDGPKTYLEVDAGIKGFLLEVDATITENINSLVAIYRRGKEQVISVIPTATHAVPSSAPSLGSKRSESGDSLPTDPNTSRGTSEAVSLSFRGQFEFQSGQCRIYSGKTRRPTKAWTTSMTSSTLATDQYPPRPSSVTGAAPAGVGDIQPDESGVQILIIPGVTFSVIGKTVLGDSSEKVVLVDHTRAVHLELLIHPSDNVLHPSIVVFFQDMIANLQIGQTRPVDEVDAPIHAELSVPNGENDNGSNTGLVGFAALEHQRHNITFVLKLSHTKVKLSCQPVSKVICALNLDSADFFFSFTPKGQESAKQRFLSCTGNIIGTSGALRHAFSPEDCFRGEIQRVTFGATMVEEKSHRWYLTEIVVPSITGNLNVRHLQDYFLFESLWSRQSTSTTPRRSPNAQSAETTSQHLKVRTDPHERQRQLHEALRSTSATNRRHAAVISRDTVRVVFKLNRVEVETDLGQSIGTSTISINELLLSGSLGWNGSVFDKRSLTFGIGEIAVKSEGRFSGLSKMTGLGVLGESYNILDSLRRSTEPGEVNDAPTSADGTADAPRQTTPQPGSLYKGTEMSIKIDQIESQLYYQYERILILEIFPISGSLSDLWRLETADAEVELDIEFFVDHVRSILSRKTVPTVLLMWRRLYSLIEEKRNAVHGREGVRSGVEVESEESESEFGNGSRSRGSNEGLGVISSSQNLYGTTSKSSTSVTTDREGPTIAFPTVLAQAGTVTCVGARVRFVLGGAFLSLTRYNFRDTDYAQLISKRIVVMLVHRPLVTAVSDESSSPSSMSIDPRLGARAAKDLTSVDIQGFAIKKCTAKKISSMEERMWTAPQWFAFMNAPSASKNVMTFPATTMQLLTITKRVERIVEFAFRTDFKGGMIDVALNIGLYRYLQELVSLYLKTMSGARTGGDQEDELLDGDVGSSGKGAAQALSTGATSETVVPDRSAIVGLKKSETESSLPPMASSSQSAASTNLTTLSDQDASLSPQSISGGGTKSEAGGDTIISIRKGLEFIRTGEVKFDPQLKVTGDATPWEWVEWLGVHQDKIPKLVYNNLTMSLRDFLNLMVVIGYHNVYVVPEGEVEIDEI